MAQTISLELQAKQRQTLKQMQRLIMSPQMQQAIHLLQLPLLELSDRMEVELAENPLLENANESLEDQLLHEEEDNSWREEESSLEQNAENELDFADDHFEILKRLDEEFRDHFAESGTYALKRTSEEDKLKTFIESTISSPPSLFEHLMVQVRETFEDPADRAVAEILVGNLDASGFFTESVSEIAFLNNFDEAKVQEILRAIQSFEPFGVGAQDLRESMLLQLRNLGKQDSIAYQIIDKCYDVLLHNRIPHIQRALGVSKNEITAAIEEDIVKLDLHPGAGFIQPINQPIVPDITLYEEGDALLVSVNDEHLPQLRFNRRYMQMLEDPEITEDAREFIKQKIQSARWFLQNIFQRNRTIERIGQSLAAKQKEFFSAPDGKLTPLTMKTLADELRLHESTIARAVANKYLYSPRGLFPLRFFFTNAYQTVEGKDISSDTVRHSLLKLIESEDKTKPLSDEALSVLLKQQGVTCARRTVAKYRILLKIGNAHQRRKYIERDSKTNF